MNRMDFRLDDHFLNDVHIDKLRIRVVYLDSGIGTWQLVYDAIDNSTKVAFEIHNTNSGRWEEKVIIMDDALIKHRGAHSADLSLVNTDKTDEIFHMIEVEKQKRLSCADMAVQY